MYTHIVVVVVIVPSRVAGREDGSYWSTGTAIGGATVECPRIAPRRNGTRSETTRRDGRDADTISLTNRRAVGTASLNEMTRNEGADLLYRQRCDITQRSVLLRCDWSSSSFALIGHRTLELLRSDWSNLEPLAPVALARAQSVEFSRTRRMTAHIRPNLFISIYFNLINSRTRKKIERRQNENGGENPSVRRGVRTRNLPIMCRAL